MSILTKKNTKAIPLNKLNGVNDEDQIMLPNFNSESEAVVKYIMEKIISLTISNHHIQTYVGEKQIAEHCFNFYHKIFNDVLQEEYIAYDRDDMELSECESEPIFFDNKYTGINDWSVLLEPKSSKIDRAASTYIKVLKQGDQKNTPIVTEVSGDKEKTQENFRENRDKDKTGYLKTDKTSTNVLTTNSSKNIAYKTVTQNIAVSDSTKSLVQLVSKSGKPVISILNLIDSCSYTTNVEAISTKFKRCPRGSVYNKR